MSAAIMRDGARPPPSWAAIALHQTLSSVKAGIHLSHLGAAKAPPQVGAIDGAVNVLVADTDT